MCKARAVLLASILTIPGFQTLAADAPNVRPDGGTVWSTQGGFAFQNKSNKKREAISGIACPSVSTSPRRCILAIDEGGAERYVVIEGNRLVLEPDNIVLQRDDEELDAEGAARDGDTIYITGSFSSKRKECETNPGSRHVFRFKVSPTTSRAALDDKGVPLGLENDKGALWDLMKKDPVLKKFAGECLGKPRHGANIEGLAVKGGILYFGFREPAEDKHTYILPVPADQLFAGTVTSATPIRVDVGGGSGIRDMLAVKDGFLLLIGPDDDVATDKSSIALWDGSSEKPKSLAKLDLKDVSPMPCKQPDDGKKAEIKPEALTLLKEDAKFWRVLVLSDGMCDGRAMSFQVPK
jgi:hypothetical protein